MPSCLRCRTLVDTKVPTAVCTLLLCAGPIEGCAAVLAVRRYCGFRSLVCAFVVFRRKAGKKTKGSLFVFLEGHMLIELMIPLALSPRRAFPQQSCVVGPRYKERDARFGAGLESSFCRRRQVSYGRGIRKGTQGSVLAWRAASLLLGRLHFLY